MFRIWIRINHCPKIFNSIFVVLERLGTLLISVADPGCLSRTPDPEFYPSRSPKLSSQKYEFGIRDPIPDLGSGKNLFRIPDPRVKKAPDPGSGSATLLLMKASPML